MKVCQNCGGEGDQKYCPNCGQALQIERININSLFHEVAHTFWHLEKRVSLYIQGTRHQSGYNTTKIFIGYSQTVSKAISIVCNFRSLLCTCSIFHFSKYTKSISPVFYKHYWFMVQAAMLPFFTLITYLLFKSRDLYYAEALVMNVYLLGFTSVCFVPINALSFFQPNLVI